MELYLLASASLLLLLFAHTSNGQVLFSMLPRDLDVSASPIQGQVLRVGEDNITVTWNWNARQSDSTFTRTNEIQLRLCYAPISQVDRGWRRTHDNLNRDRSCQFTIAHVTSITRENQSFTGLIAKDVPSATYFVRAYAYDSAGNEIAYGQTTDNRRTTNLFEVQAVSGRHESLTIASTCFSVFALLSAVGFFFIEKRNTKRSAKD